MWHNDDISKVQVLENDSGTLLGGAACFALLQFHLALLLPSPGGNTSQGQSSSSCLQGGFFLGGFSKSYHLSSPTSSLPFLFSLFSPLIQSSLLLILRDCCPHSHSIVMVIWVCFGLQGAADGLGGQRQERPLMSKLAQIVDPDLLRQSHQQQLSLELTT